MTPANETVEREIMAKEDSTVYGKDVVVRENTAKAYRFVVWGVTTAAICLAIMGVIAFALLYGNATDKGAGNSSPRTLNIVHRLCDRAQTERISARMLSNILVSES